MSEKSQNDTLLEVENLRIAFKTDEGLLQAIDGVSFSVQRGKTLGIVGESGSGKSVSTRAIMRLLARNAVIDPESKILVRRADGSIVDVIKMDNRGSEIRSIRGNQVAMIFQEPMRSFSPVYTIGNQLSEAILAHQNFAHQKNSKQEDGKTTTGFEVSVGQRQNPMIASALAFGKAIFAQRSIDKREAKKIAISLLDRVGISNPTRRFDQYSFELSGGQRQRAMIAVALAANPSILIADEPTTALDVTIQAQILQLMKELQDEIGMGIIFITHDLGVISQIADDVAVMYLGRIMETGTVRDVVKNPKHPYTQSLLRAIPKIENLNERLVPVGGDIPTLLSRPSGCPFHPRCQQFIQGYCDGKEIYPITISETHSVNCFLYEEGRIDETATAES
jgi:peptide/nickel transport system ATP-binding protein